MKLILSIASMAIITYLIRFIPFAILKKPIQNPFIRKFLYYVPYSVLAAMTFPAIFYSTGNITASIIATILALILGFCECSLIVIAICAVIAALIMIMIF